MLLPGWLDGISIAQHGDRDRCLETVVVDFDLSRPDLLPVGDPLKQMRPLIDRQRSVPCVRS